MFTDDDLFFWKQVCGNHEQYGDVENLEIHPGTLKDIIARLEAAERCVELCSTDENCCNIPELVKITFHHTVYDAKRLERRNNV